ncbi:MAG: hypothetical protein M0Z48_11655 [Nitrospiraceae bacterium]|nr:hypothetical protein [Nitrospiraceae bacterium]
MSNISLSDRMAVIISRAGRCLSFAIFACLLFWMTAAAYAGITTQHYDFAYPDRTGLISAGWNFNAVTPSGGLRNTEQTTGAVVSYDQTAHPGVLQIPADTGDLWDNANNSRNTLFRTLPPDWTSIRLKLFFGPSRDYQQAGLLREASLFQSTRQDYQKASTMPR